jgi:glycosyltransferase involved in cell wall biosynthesis
VDAVVFPSSAFRDQARERYGVDASGNGSVIPNAADPERMLKVASTVRDELGVDESATIIGMIGNFYRDPRKDQLTLVKALPKVFAEFPNAHCLFIGKTEPGAEHKLNACKQFCIENGIDQRVHFLGSRGDVPNILATLDVFVLSSLEEGAPVAILEAIFAHVPVVASDIPPHVEYTCDKPILKLFRTSNDVDLSSKIINLLEDQTAARKMANCAYDHALKNFSTSVRLERLKNLYERLLSE